MSINFFKNDCKTSSNNTEFGICDEPKPSTDPAYIDNSNLSEWIAIVKNSKNEEINFYAIDNCIEILRENGEDKESRCDGFLHYDNNIIFVELKDRGSSGWLKKGREQITITINKFLENNSFDDFNTVEAYVCNKQRPLAITGNNTEIQKFKDDTGLILNISKNIEI